IISSRRNCFTTVNIDFTIGNMRTCHFGSQPGCNYHTRSTIEDQLTQVTSLRSSCFQRCSYGKFQRSSEITTNVKLVGVCWICKLDSSNYPTPLVKYLYCNGIHYSIGIG